MIKPLFSLRLVNRDKSNFGWDRIDVLQLMPYSISKAEHYGPEDKRTHLINYGMLYIGDGHLTMGNFDEDLMPEIEDGTYALYEDIEP